MAEYKAPLRVSFTGIASDVPSRIGYSMGSSICAAIDKYMYVSITTNNHEPAFVDPPCDLIEDLLLRVPFRADIPRMQIRWSGDVPLGSGLGGSAALLVAVAKHFFNRPDYQAFFASCVELDRGAGWQDSAIAAYGGCRIFNYRYDNFFLSESFSAFDTDCFMLVNSHVSHDTAKQYAVPESLSLDDILVGNERVLRFRSALKDRDYLAIGYLVNEVHVIKNCRLLYSFSKMDEFLSKVFLCGAYGGKLLGSGGGGHFLLVVDPEKRDSVRCVVDRFGFSELPFRFI